MSAVARAAGSEVVAEREGRGREGSGDEGSGDEGSGGEGVGAVGTVGLFGFVRVAVSVLRHQLHVDVASEVLVEGQYRESSGFAGRLANEVVREIGSPDFERINGSANNQFAFDGHASSAKQSTQRSGNGRTILFVGNSKNPSYFDQDGRSEVHASGGDALPES